MVTTRWVNDIHQTEANVRLKEWQAEGVWTYADFQGYWPQKAKFLKDFLCGDDDCRCEEHIRRRFPKEQN